MSPEELIASGLLEGYLMGIASDEEAALVEQMAAVHPAVRQELDRLEQTLEDLAFQDAVDPPPHLKDKIWDQLRSMPEAEEPVLRKWTGNRNIWSPLAIAAVVLLALSIVLNVYMASQWYQAKNALTKLEVWNVELARKAVESDQKLAALDQQMDFLSSPDTRQVALLGVGTFTDAKAAVFWNPADGRVFFQDISMPAIRQNEQYQLWAIVDGQPVDAGTLDKDQKGLIAMHLFREAQAFAITIEPLGGSQKPTLDAMVVMGEV